jgi:hypothetical protein
MKKSSIYITILLSAFVIFSYIIFRPQDSAFNYVVTCHYLGGGEPTNPFPFSDPKRMIRVPHEYTGNWRHWDKDFNLILSYNLKKGDLDGICEDYEYYSRSWLKVAKLYRDDKFICIAERVNMPSNAYTVKADLNSAGEIHGYMRYYDKGNCIAKTKYENNVLRSNFAYWNDPVPLGFTGIWTQSYLKANAVKSVNLIIQRVKRAYISYNKDGSVDEFCPYIPKFNYLLIYKFKNGGIDSVSILDNFFIVNGCYCYGSSYNPLVNNKYRIIDTLYINEPKSKHFDKYDKENRCVYIEYDSFKFAYSGVKVPFPNEGFVDRELEKWNKLNFKHRTDPAINTAKPVLTPKPVGGLSKYRNKMKVH